MGKIITLPAGADKLVIQSMPNDWCPVLVETPSQTWLLGKDNFVLIIGKLIRGLKASYNSKVSEPQGILTLMDPHGAMYIQDKKEHDILLFQGKDAPRVFHSMTLSPADKKQWINILDSLQVEEKLSEYQKRVVNMNYKLTERGVERK